MTIDEVYDALPMSEKTLVKHWHRGQYKNLPCLVKNDQGHPCEWRVEYAGETIGMVKYYKGRKLCAYGVRA